MKKILLVASAVLATLLVSCSNEKEISHEVGGDGEGLVVIQAKTDRSVDKIETRANTDQELYLLEADNGSKKTSRAFGDGKMSLNVGTYTLTVTSEQSYVLPAWNLPVYQGKAEGVVVKETETPLPVAITCTQINSGVRFVFDQSVKKYYNSLTVKIEEQVGNESLEYGYTNETDEDIAYFEPGFLELSLTDDQGDPVKIGGETVKLIEVKKKELWTITLKTSSTLPGEVEISIIVDEETDNENPEFGIGDIEGEGIQSSPYSVAGAVNAMPAQGVWVEGYVVASTTITRAESNAVLIGGMVAADASKCLILEIPADASAAFKAALEVGEKIKIQADIVGKADFTTDAIGVLSNVVNFDNDARDVSADNTDPITINGKTLKDLATAAGPIFRMGATVKTDNMFSSSPAPAGYTNLLKRDYTSVTMEYEMKMNQQLGITDYRKTWHTQFKSYCPDNNLDVHGHTLVWYSDVPEDWEALSTSKIKESLEEYIEETMLTYSYVRSWDVVNEAVVNVVGDGDTGADGYWNCLWKTAYGSGEAYVREAFTIARNVAKRNGLTCKLFYNDYKSEYYPLKRERIINMVNKLNEEYAAANGGELLIDGIGLQMHLVAGIDKANLEAAIQAAVETGCLVHLSEVSVALADSEDKVPATITQEMLDAQTQTFVDLFDAAFSLIPKDKFWGITFWGVTDYYSIYTKRQGMLFDADFNAKPAYFELINRWSN